MERLRSYLIPLGLVATTLGSVVWSAFQPLLTLPLLAALAAMAAAWMYRSNHTLRLLHVMAFCMPLSTEVSLGASNHIFFPAEPLTAVAALVLLMELYNKKALLFNTLRRHSAVVLAFVLPLIWATLASGMNPISIKYSVVFVGYLVTFFLLLGLHASSVHHFLSSYTLGLVPVAIWSLWQWQGYGFNPITVKGIFLPFFKDHTILGATTALVGMYWFAQASFYKKRWAWAAALLCFGLTYLSGSRAAWWSVVVATILLSMYPLKITLRSALLASFAGALLVAFNWNDLVAAMQANTHQSRSIEGDDLDKALSATNLQSDESNVERLNRWHAAWEMFKENPVAGHGPGQYQFVYHPYQTPQFFNRLTVSDPWHIPENSGGTAHSEFLLALSEQGIGGGLAWLIFWGMAIWLGFGTRLKIPPTPTTWILFLPLVTYLLHSQVNNFLTSASFAFPFWLLASQLFSTDERVLQQG